MLKKYAVICLVVCLSAPFIGSFIWLKHQKHQVKKSIKKEIIAGIDSSELEKLSFTLEQSQTDLEWEHSKEFEYQGNMYDIVKQEIVGDSIFYLCWLDVEETVLNKKLSALLAVAWGNNQSKDKQQSYLSTFIKSLSFHQQEEFYLNKNWTYTEQSFCFISNRYSSIYKSPTAPPPRL